MGFEAGEKIEDRGDVSFGADKLSSKIAIKKDETAHTLKFAVLGNAFYMKSIRDNSDESSDFGSERTEQISPHVRRSLGPVG